VYNSVSLVLKGKCILLVVQSKDEDRSSQKGGVSELSVCPDESQLTVDQEEQQGNGSLEVSRSGTTRRVTRASARSQQQRGRSSADGMNSFCYCRSVLCCVTYMMFAPILWAHLGLYLVETHEFFRLFFLLCSV